MPRPIAAPAPNDLFKLSISTGQAAARNDELFEIRFILPLNLRQALGELFIGDELSSGELIRPLERHAKLIVGCENPCEIGIAPGRLRLDELRRRGRRGSSCQGRRRFPCRRCRGL